MNKLLFSMEDKCRLTLPSEFASKKEGDALVIEGTAVNFDTVFPKLRSNKLTVESGSIDQLVIDYFMKKPILLASHDMESWPVGKVLKMELRPGLLWFRGLVEKTQANELLIKNIERGTVGSVSIGFFMEEPEYDEETGVWHIKRITELIDLSIVNKGRDEDAVFEIAQNQNFNMGTERLAPVYLGRNRMVDDKAITPEMLAEVQKDVSDLKVTLGEIKPEQLEKIAGLEKIVETFKADQTRTKDEYQSFIKKFMGDFNSAQEKLADEMKALRKEAAGPGTVDNLPLTPEQALSLDENILKGMFTDNRFQQIKEFRGWCDLLVFTSQMMNPQQNEMGIDAQFKIDPEQASKLKCFKEVGRQAERFAMDAATSAEGSQFIPVGYSPEMINLIRLESKVDGLFNTFPMMEANMYKMAEGADILPTRMTETTAVQTARADSTEQTPGTNRAQFTAEKLRTRVQISGEMTEDSMIEIFNFVKMKTAIGYARGLDKGEVSGDNAGGTGFDSGDTPGSTDVRYCFDGLRADAYNNSTNNMKLDMSTFDFEQIVKLISLFDKYGVVPSDLTFIISAKSYFFNWIGKIAKEYMATLEKAGSSAVIFTGQVNQFLGIPIVLSEWILSTFDAQGVYSGAGQNKTIELLVNRKAFERGIYRPIQMEVVRNAHFDIWDVIAWHRTDFQKVMMETGAQVAAYGHNVPTQ